MDRRVLYHLFFYTENITLEIVTQWFKAASEYIQPDSMRGKTISNGKSYKYNEKKFYSGLEKEINSGRLRPSLSDYNNKASISIVQNAQSPQIVSFSFIAKEDNIHVNFDQLLDQLMIKNGIVAFKCSLTDDFLQNTQFISDYEYEKKSFAGLKTKMSSIWSGEEVIDTEYNPGHSHRPKNIWFGSCHKMWFGNPYYQYIGKEKFINFSNCFENIFLDNDVIRITLYQDLWDYDNPENRERQWNFRKSTGMDEAATLLENAESGQNEPGPEIEILTGQFAHGGVRIINHYLDADDNPAYMKKAVKVKTYEFSEKGIILFQEEKTLNE